MASLASDYAIVSEYFVLHRPLFFPCWSMLQKMIEGKFLSL